jgi:hypothetical protein
MVSQSSSSRHHLIAGRRDHDSGSACRSRGGARRRILLAGLLLAGLVAALAARADELRKFRIFYSTDFLCAIEPCGCEGTPYGGLAKRATYIRTRVAADEHAIIVDAGDFLAETQESDDTKCEFLVRGLDAIGIDAMNLGEKDFSRGQAFLRHLQEDLGAPLISSNIVYRDTRELFATPYKVIHFAQHRFLGFRWGGVSVGIFGLLSNEFPPRVLRAGDRPLAVLDPWETARAMAEELRPRCDLLICLAHLGYDQAERLAGECPQIDVIVSGHGRLRMDGSRRMGRTVLVHSRTEGKFVADLALTMNDEGEIVHSQAIQLPLDEEYEDDPEIAALLEEYHQILVDRRPPRPTGDPVYAGAFTCTPCHQAEYRQWSGSAHATALSPLNNRGEEQNPECLPCHTTGFAKPGGFYDPASTPTMAGVQCESCHGPALAHVRYHRDGGTQPPPLSRATEAAACTGCHDAVQDPQFDIEQSLPLVLH